MSGLQAHISRCLGVSGNIRNGIRLYIRKGLRILPLSKTNYSRLESFVYAQEGLPTESIEVVEKRFEVTVK